MRTMIQNYTRNTFPSTPPPPPTKKKNYATSHGRGCQQISNQRKSREIFNSDCRSQDVPNKMLPSATSRGANCKYCKSGMIHNLVKYLTVKAIVFCQASKKEPYWQVIRLQTYQIKVVIWERTFRLCFNIETLMFLSNYCKIFSSLIL